MDRENNVVQIPKHDIGGFGFEFVMAFKSAFWNDMFEKKLPKLKDRLDAIFLRHLLEAINDNITIEQCLIICKITLLTLHM
jgi:hypothetical protein